MKIIFCGYWIWCYLDTKSSYTYMTQIFYVITAFSLLFSFSFTFIPSSSSCSPATGCCLSLLRHQFLVLLGAESQALPREPLHRGGHRRNISCPRSLARASGSGSRELACRPGEFAADSRHYAC